MAKRISSITVSLLLLCLVGPAWSQTTTVRGAVKGTSTAQPVTATPTDTNHTGLDVNIVGGAGSGGTSATDNSAFTGSTTGVTPIGALYDTTPPTITDGNVGTPRMDSNRNLHVNCISGCAGAAGDGTTTGALGVLNAAVSIALSTYNGADLNFTSGGSLSGTVVAEVSTDGGTTWVSAVFADPTNGTIATSLSSPTSGSYTIMWPGSISHARVRVSAYTTGTTTATLRTTAVNTSVLVYGSDGTNLRPLSTNTSGRLQVDVVSGTVTVTDGAGALNVIVDSSALPTGAATAANQDGIIKDGTGDTTQANVTSGRLNVDGSGVTQPVSGTVTITDGAGALNVIVDSGAVSVSGTVAATQSGTWNITNVSGPVTVTDGVGALNVIVDSGTLTAVTSISTPVTVTDGAGALNVICDSGCSGGAQFNQGTAATATDALTMAGAVRHDTAAVDAGVIDGDRVGLSTDSVGRLRVTATDTTQPVSAASLPLPTGASTLAEQQTQTTALQIIDNIVSGTGANISQFGGTNVVTGTGASGVGIPRVTISSDSSLAANQSTNVAQVNGATTQIASNGLNTTGAGLQAHAVVGQCDDTTPTALTENQFGHARINCTTHHQIVEVAAALPTGSNVIGALSANQSVNVAQINGVAPTMGNGVSGTGVQRVTMASDSTGQTKITDGTDTALVSATGELSVNCGNCSGSGASHIDNAAFTGGTDDVAPSGALYDTTPPAITDGSLGAPRMDANRLLYSRPSDGTNTMPMMDAAARAGFQKITDGTDTANVSATGKLETTCDNCGGSSFADNSAFTFGTTNVMPTGYVFDDTAPNAVTENNAAAPRMSANRVPYAQLRDAAGNERGANVNASNQLTVSVDNTVTVGSHAVTNAGTFATQAAQSGTWTVQPGNTANTTPWLVKPHDGTNAGTIKAASTAAVATDTALVVAVSPNNTIAATQSGAWSLSANQSVNVAQMNGVATTMGNGIAGTGVQRVTVASDSTGTTIATQATAANLNVRPDTSGATAAAPPARANFVGGLTSGATGGFMTGIAVCDSFVNVTVSSATTTLLVTGVSGRHVRICGISLVTAAANNVALVSGTGATCATGTTGMTGGTTAATGYNLAANGGIAQGSGLGAINQTNATGDSVCVITSAATQLSGRLSYAIY